MSDTEPTVMFEPVWKGMCLVDTKTKGSRRVIPMLPPLRAALWALRGQSSGRLVFTRPDGRPIVAADDTDAWRAISKRSITDNRSISVSLAAPKTKHPQPIAGAGVLFVVTVKCQVKSQTQKTL